MNRDESSAVQDLRVLPFQLERDAYEVLGKCVNCGWRGTLKIAMGEEVPGKGAFKRPAYCRRCGCSGLIRDPSEGLSQ